MNVKLACSSYNGYVYRRHFDVILQGMETIFSRGICDVDNNQTHTYVLHT